MSIMDFTSRSRGILLLLILVFVSNCTRKAPPAIIDTKDAETRRIHSKMQYLLRCASCHGEFGEGKIGPNLTDDFWIHGDGTKGALISAISEGVVRKGMPAWKNVYHADDISAIADFVQTLQGTNPKDAKAPEGEKMTSKLEIITPNDPNLKTEKIPTH